MNMKSDIFQVVFLVFALVKIASVESKTLVAVHVNSLNDAEISYRGASREIISDAEAEQWGIWPVQKCISVIKAHTNNKESPKQCYLHEPTEGERYLEDHVLEVTSVHEIIKATKMPVEEKEIILATKHHENNSTNPLTIKYSLQKTVMDSISHSSYSDSNITVGGSADFEIFGTGGIGFNAEYKHVWGKAEEKSNSKSIGVATETTITVPPRSSSTVTFKTRMVSMAFEIMLSNHLEGFIATKKSMFDVYSVKETQNKKIFKEKIAFNVHQEGYIVVDERPITKQKNSETTAARDGRQGVILEKNEL